MIASLLQKPEKGGTPMIASHPRPNVTQVIFIAVRRLPKRRMSTSSFMPCMTEPAPKNIPALRSEEHTSELQSRGHLVCRLLLEKKKQQHKLNTEVHRV